MIKTSGKDWLVNNGGRSWCKLLRRIEDVDLHEKGGYAIKAPFVNFDKPVMMDAGFFLVVASQYPANTEWEYRFKLIEILNGQLREVTEDQIYRTVYAALDTGVVIPEERESSAMGNWQYMAAVYAVMAFRGMASRPAFSMPGRQVTGGMRKIIRLNPGGGSTPAAAPALPLPTPATPTAAPPKPVSPLPVHHGKPVAQALREALEAEEVCHCGELIRNHTSMLGCHNPVSMGQPAYENEFDDVDDIANRIASSPLPVSTRRPRKPPPGSLHGQG